MPRKSYKGNRNLRKVKQSSRSSAVVEIVVKIIKVLEKGKKINNWDSFASHIR